jgi:MFS family permease
MAGVMTIALVGLMLLDTGLRSEFAELGAGPWVNIPMFTAVVYGYGLFANRLIDRFGRKRSLVDAEESVEVPT